MSAATKKKWASILERMGRAFAGAFVAQLALSGLGTSGVDDLSNLKKAGLAGAAALLSFVQSMVGGNVGNPATPSLLPASLDPADPAAVPETGQAEPSDSSFTYPPDHADYHLGLSGPKGIWPTTMPEETIAGSPIARGIHAHASKKLGRRPASNKPALMLGDHLTAAVPVHPIADVAPNLVWPMDHNDEAGDCVVAGLDHALQAIYTALTGGYTNWTDDELLKNYQSQNPGFESWADAGGAHDNGMDIQTFLAYLVKTGVILGFAKVDQTNEDVVKAAINLGLGIVTGEDLQKAQQAQKVWDYKKSADWGGHCTVWVGYPGSPDVDTCVTWGELVNMTQAFVGHQVEEAWFILTQAHVDHPDFRAGFDLASFAAAYTALTGRPFPVTIPPTPSPMPPAPTPAPGDATFQEALDAVPGLASWVAKTAAKHGLSIPAYLASLAAKQAHLN